MKVALFHNWSTLGGAVARALLSTAADELLLVGAAAEADELDLELLDEAARRGVPCGVAPDVASDAFRDDLASFAPDVVLVATFPSRLGPGVLGLPARGAFNVHGSLLPAYRGAMPEFWAIRNGEAVTGVSIHRMTERFDAGPIVARERVPIEPDESLRSLSVKLGVRAAPMAAALLDRLRDGDELAGEPQDESLATRAPMPTAWDLELRWSDPAASLERLVRAAFDAFEAVTSFRGAPLVVRGARALAGPAALDPGELAWDGAALRVGTGDGLLALERIEIAGRRITAAGFVADAALAPGERFGTSR